MRQIFPNPTPGVWELIVENDNVIQGKLPPSLQSAATFNLSAAAARVEVSPATLTIDRDLAQATTSTEISFINRLSSFSGGLTDSPLGSAFRDRPTLTANNAQQVYEIEVPPGTEYLDASIGEPSDPAADLDLYLIDCTGSEPKIKDYSGEPGSQETVGVANPSSGTWKVIIDTFSAPSGKTTVEYRDIYTHRLFGTIKGTDLSVERKIIGVCTARIDVRGQAVPIGRRYLAGIIEVTSEDFSSVTASVPDARRRNTFIDLRRRVALGTAIVETKRDPDFPQSTPRH